MKVLITGITGFVGGYLAEQSLAVGDDVLGCSTHGGWPPKRPERRSPGGRVWELIDLLGWELGDRSCLS
jgi:nucleoside-diphosphate-sugar epimerase